MNRNFLRALMVVAIAGLISTNARASKVSDMEAEIAALNARLDQVEQREESYRKDVEAQKKAGADQALELKKGQADLKVDIANLRSQLSQLEEVQRELSQKLSELENKISFTPQPGSIPDLTTASADSVGNVAPGAKPAAEAGAVAKLKAESSNPGYDLGMKYFGEGKYDAARAQFEAFVKANPASPLSEDAAYRIAECYYQLKDYKRAAVEFNGFTQKYPKSKKVPAASLRVGLCLERLGKKDEAKTTYEDLIATYPKSSEAMQAKTLLDKLNQPAPQPTPANSNKK